MIYYPFINVPKNAFIIQSILYWDYAWTISPENYVATPPRYSDFTRELIDSGMLKVAHPARYLDYNAAHKFINHMISKYERVGATITSFKNRDAKRNKIVNINTNFTMYLDKMSFELMSTLVRYGFAERISMDLYSVDRRIAVEYMAFLAGMIGRNKDVNATPITDSLSNLMVSNKCTNNDLYQIRNTLLNNIFPIPQTVNIRTLLDLKNRYSNEMKTFRNYIEIKVIECARIPKEQRQEYMLRIRKTIDEDVNNLTDSMKWSVKKIVNSTLIPISTTLLTSLSLIFPPLALVAGCANIAKDISHIFCGDKTINANNALTYAAILNNRFSVRHKKN